MALTLLPVEIQRRIIAHVSSLRDLAALSQSCSLLHDLCDMKARHRFLEIGIKTTDDSINEAFNLMLEILRRPYLGKYVMRMGYFDGPAYGHPFVETEKRHDIDLSDMNLLRSAVQKAGFVDSEARAVFNMLMQNPAKASYGPLELSLENLRQRKNFRLEQHIFMTQALAAILISISPYLEELWVAQPFLANATPFHDTTLWNETAEWPPEEPDYPLERFFRQANDKPLNIPYLQNLRRVSMLGNERKALTNPYFDFPGCASLFNQLPSIELFANKSFHEEIGTEDGPGLILRSSNFRSIHLNHCFASAGQLSRIIDSCRQLREFQYRVDLAFPNVDAPFNAQTFIRSIFLHRETLQVLDIDVEHDMTDLKLRDFDNAHRLDQIVIGHRDDPETDDQISVSESFARLMWENTGSLKEFHELKRLSMGIKLLIYFAMAPKWIWGTGGIYRFPVTQSGQPIRLLEELPDGLEYLHIRDYRPGRSMTLDVIVDALMELHISGRSSIREIKLND